MIKTINKSGLSTVVAFVDLEGGVDLVGLERQLLVVVLVPISELLAPEIQIKNEM